MKQHTSSSFALRGYLMLTAIVFGAIFLTVLGALTSFVLTENRARNANDTQSRALAIAEAGLEYYRWHLAHFPTDMQNGTGAAGPYTINYNDPEGGSIGNIQLTVTGNTSCNQITSVDIQSKGTTSGSPAYTKTIFARYARPTVATYSYILNSSVWAGSDRVILGPYHSNGGIRMDGSANSPVTSSLSTWSCTPSFGCTPTTTKSGVFGTGTNQNLWDYPTPQVDFAAISANFSNLKATATSSGLYFATNGNASSGGRGYHLIFNGNGTVTVRTVSSAVSIVSIPVDGTSNSPVADYTVINNEANLGTYTIPANCGLIFVEDDVWVEGTIDTKVTLVAADVTNSGVTPTAVLKNNITYSTYTGTAGLTLIAENNVLVAANSPSTMTLNGIFIAQSGAFGRNLYLNNSQSNCNATYEPRTSLTILGTTVSNKRTGTKWLNGCAAGDAGYQTRVDSFDRTISTNAPPFTPAVSTEYQFVDWREQ
jgi:hypothetical protein